MHTRKLMILIVVLICGVAAVPRTNVPASTLPADKTETVIPFEYWSERGYEAEDLDGHHW